MKTSEDTLRINSLDLRVAKRTDILPPIQSMLNPGFASLVSSLLHLLQSNSKSGCGLAVIGATIKSVFQISAGLSGR
jgi:hypothetical protein